LILLGIKNIFRIDLYDETVCFDFLYSENGCNYGKCEMVHRIPIEIFNYTKFNSNEVENDEMVINYIKNFKEGNQNFQNPSFEKIKGIFNEKKISSYTTSIIINNKIVINSSFHDLGNYEPIWKELKLKIFKMLYNDQLINTEMPITEHYIKGEKNYHYSIKEIVKSSNKDIIEPLKYLRDRINEFKDERFKKFEDQHKINGDNEKILNQEIIKIFRYVQVYKIIDDIELLNVCSFYQIGLKLMKDYYILKKLKNE
jgi:hypothetical protein